MLETTGVKHTDRTLENKTRMTIKGGRYRVGNANHPHHALYKDEGFTSVFKAMGLIENTAFKIKQEVLAMYNEYAEGYVYVISNPAWEGWFKVGMAVDAYDRCAQYQTSSPYRDYVVEYCKYFEDRRKAESSAHALLEGVEQRGEWFNAELSVIKNKIKTIEGA